MPLTLQTTTILAEFVGTKQRWSWYLAGVKIRHLAGNSSRQLDQFEARATRKIALRYSVSVGRSERPLRPVPATAPCTSNRHTHPHCNPVVACNNLRVLSYNTRETIFNCVYCIEAQFSSATYIFNEAFP